MVIVAISFFLLLLLSVSAGAEANRSVSVKPILPNNQHDLSATYYDLRVIPGQEQELELKITNPSDTDQRVMLQINDATTNDLGDIDYSNRTTVIPRDSTLKTSLKDIATVHSEMWIPAKETKTAIVKLKVPKDQFDGMILGGIKVVSHEEKTTKSSEMQGGKVYIVAVKLTENDEPIAAELDLVKMISTQGSGEQVVKATIQNSQPVNLEDIEYSAKIYTKDSNELIHQTKVTGYQMAPNSSFTWNIKNDQQKLQVGNYNIYVSAKSLDTNQEWQWEKELEIVDLVKQEESNSFSHSGSENMLMYMIICVGLTVVLLVFLLVWLILRRRKERRYKEAVYYRNKRKNNNESFSKNKLPRKNKRRRKHITNSYQE